MFSLTLLAAIVNHPVTSIYLQPEQGTEIDSQAIYGSPLTVLEENGEWSRVEAADGVIGWVLSSDLAQNKSFERGESLRPVKNLFAHVYRFNDTTPAPPLLTLPYGAKVKVLSLEAPRQRWIEIELASGQKGWIQEGDLEWDPKVKSLSEVLTLSRKFLGLPYTWGGTSSYGFDCSGFVQMLYKEMGIGLPRNARDQAKSDLLAPVSREELEPGDLLFFGQSKITHVGIYLGNGEFIHSGVKEGPLLRISSLESGMYHLLECRRLKKS